MEPESSLPCSQQPATGLYPDPDNPTHTIQSYFPRIPFNIILPCSLDRPSGLTSSGFPISVLYTCVIVFFYIAVHVASYRFMKVLHLLMTFINDKKWRI
jgi:hypothetical protein